MASLVPFADFLDPWDVFERISESFDSDTERPNYATERPQHVPRRRNPKRGWIPRVEVTEDETGNLNVEAEVPGVSPADLQLHLRDGSLVISGVKKSPAESKNEEDGEVTKKPPAKRSRREQPYVYSERQYGKFRRVIKLPKEVNTCNITASCKDGVLHIFIPVQEEASKVSIPIAFS
eukprot:jgi/Galph1/1083/GphlegSOOS_G5829.1